MMNLVFANSLEKQADDRVYRGQVSICEQHGKWLVHWSSDEPSGKVVQETWYEGIAWDEMMHVFRHKITEKMSEGFLPVLEGVTDQFTVPKGKAELQEMIVCYSELHRNEQLYEQLREWRKTAAVRENKAAYFIATNRVLGLISAYIPHTMEELRQIPGFGAHRSERYGEAILEITKKFERKTTFPLYWVPDTLERKQFTLWYYRKQYVKLTQENEKRERKKQLLEMLEQGATLETIGERLDMNARDAILWIEQIEEEGYRADRFIEQEMRRIPEQLRQAALAAFEKLGDEYLKPILREVYGDEPEASEQLSRLYIWLRILRMYYRRSGEMPVGV